MEWHCIDTVSHPDLATGCQRVRIKKDNTMTKTNTMAAPLAIEEAPTPSIVSAMKPKGKPISIIDILAAENSEASVGKTATMQEARQLLARFVEMTEDSGHITREAATLSGRASFLLTVALSEGHISETDVTGAMGDVFGYVAKKDGTPGKTPNKEGSAIQKRVFRANGLATFVATGGKSGDGFFSGMSLTSSTGGNSPRTVLDIYEGMKAGTIPVFSAYKYLQDVKSNNRPKASPTFDAAKVNAMVKDLGSLDVSVEAILSNAQLRGAYVALAEVWAIVTEEAGRVYMERKAA